MSPDAERYAAVGAALAHRSLAFPGAYGDNNLVRIAAPSRRMKAQRLE